MYICTFIMDIWDKKKRSEVMSKIRSKNTKPEIALRKALYSRGLRYRVNYKKLPGKPDIVFTQYNTVIFVHGCFWHGHDNCGDSHIPKTNTEFWSAKIARNKERDNNNIMQILSMGWKVLIIWDCEIQQKDNIRVLIQKIEDILLESIHYNQTKISIKLYKEIEGNVAIVAEDVVEYKQKQNS